MLVGKANNAELISNDNAVRHAFKAVADKGLHLPESLGGDSDFLNTPGEVFLVTGPGLRSQFIRKFQVLQIQLNDFPAKIVRQGKAKGVGCATPKQG